LKLSLTTLREIPEDEVEICLAALRHMMPWLDIETVMREGRQQHTSGERLPSGAKTTATTWIEVIP
jgi:hypothetical protein